MPLLFVEWLQLLDGQPIAFLRNGLPPDLSDLTFEQVAESGVYQTSSRGLKSTPTWDHPRSTWKVGVPSAQDAWT